MVSANDKVALAKACTTIKSLPVLGIRKLCVCLVQKANGTHYLATTDDIQSVLVVPNSGKSTFFIEESAFGTPDLLVKGIIGAVFAYIVSAYPDEEVVQHFPESICEPWPFAPENPDEIMLAEVVKREMPQLFAKPGHECDLSFIFPCYDASEIDGNITALPVDADFSFWITSRPFVYKTAEECRGQYQLPAAQGFPVLGERKPVSKKLLVLPFVEKMVQTIKDSYEDGEDGEIINNVLLYGPSAGGKSVAVQVAAALFNLPFYGFNVGPGTTEVGLFGGFVPKTNDASDLFAAKFAEEYGEYCNSITDYDIECTPEESLARLGYKPLPGEKHEALSNNLRDIVTNVKAQSATAKGDTSNAGEFRYAVSTFIQCFAFGGIIDFAEGQLSQNQALLGALNSGLSDGYVIMPMSGQIIRRHPHCIIVMTGNIGVGHFGAKQLTQSVYSRLLYKAEVPDLLPDELAAIARMKFGPKVEEQIGTSLQNMAIVFTNLRESAKSSNVADVSGTLCGRTFTAWVQQSRRNGLIEAAKTTVVPSSSQVIENQRKVWSLFKPMLENLSGGELT